MRIDTGDQLANCSEDVRAANPGLFGLPAPPDTYVGKQNKYHVAPKVERTYNGIVYHSKKEVQKAQELDLMVKAGDIDFWLRQVPFVIGYDPLTVYVADFVTFKLYRYDHDNWDIAVLEVKPASEKAWAPGAKRKLKQFRQKYPNLKIEVI
jgi:hypothetical protein